jgi:hypothetical protein
MKYLFEMLLYAVLSVTEFFVEFYLTIFDLEDASEMTSVGTLFAIKELKKVL